MAKQYKCDVKMNVYPINVYARSFRNISPRIWNALQKKIDVNVSITKYKSTSKMYFMEHDLEIMYTK